MRALALLLAAGCGAAAGGDEVRAEPPVVTAAPATHPLATARAVPPVTWTGTVMEVVEAGSYVYLWVEAEAGPRWVGTLALEAAQGQQVNVRPIAELDTYASARTGRTFEHLQLAWVSAVPGT